MQWCLYPFHLFERIPLFWFLLIEINIYYHLGNHSYSLKNALVKEKLKAMIEKTFFGFHHKKTYGWSEPESKSAYSFSL